MKVRLEEETEHVWGDEEVSWCQECKIICEIICESHLYEGVRVSNKRKDANPGA